MTLDVILIRYPNGAAVKDTRRTFREHGGTIGRGQDNFWILEDPDRYLSSRHVQISCGGGRYYLTDLSTNGTFLNGAAEPVGKGSRVELKSGDTFSLGDYEFRVEPVRSSGQSGFDSGGFSDDPFAPVPTPFGAGASGPADSNDNAFFSSPPVASGPDTLFGLTQKETDPLAALDKAGRFCGATPAGEFSYSDRADPINQSVNWPQAVPQQGGIIPEDWDITSLGAAQPQDSCSIAPDSAGKPPARPVPAAPPFAGAVTETPKQNPPRQTSAPSIETKPAVGGPARASVPRTSGAANRGTGGAAETRPAGGALEQALVAALGLGNSGLSPERVAEINSVVGQLVRETVAGLMQVLSSRSAIKNEFRMQVTTIKPVENNPLKFSATVDDALENMFVKQGKAYKGPVEAVREGFESIAEHQMAVVAGIRSAFRAVMECFDPTQLERRFEKRSKGTVVLGSRKAKYWDAYCEHYQGLIGDLDNSFQHLFGDEFVQAYEDQLRKLAMARGAKNRID